MGWVNKNLADGDENGEGLIIGLHDDEKLKYALEMASAIQFMRYEVEFRLVE